MIDIRCTREGYECEGCCIKDKCDNLEQTNQVNLWEIYKQGRADAIDKCTETYLDVIEDVLHDKDLSITSNQALTIYARIMNRCYEKAEELKEQNNE